MWEKLQDIRLKSDGFLIKYINGLSLNLDLGYNGIFCTKKELKNFNESLNLIRILIYFPYEGFNRYASVAPIKKKMKKFKYFSKKIPNFNEFLKSVKKNSSYLYLLECSSKYTVIKEEIRLPETDYLLKVLPFPVLIYRYKFLTQSFQVQDCLAIMSDLQKLFAQNTSEHNYLFLRKLHKTKNLYKLTYVVVGQRAPFKAIAVDYSGDLHCTILVYIKDIKFFRNMLRENNFFIMRGNEAFGLFYGMEARVFHDLDVENVKKIYSKNFNNYYLFRRKPRLYKPPTDRGWIHDEKQLKSERLLGRLIRGHNDYLGKPKKKRKKKGYSFRETYFMDWKEFKNLHDNFRIENCLPYPHHFLDQIVMQIYFVKINLDYLDWTLFNFETWDICFEIEPRCKLLDSDFWKEFPKKKRGRKKKIEEDNVVCDTIEVEYKICEKIAIECDAKMQLFSGDWININYYNEIFDFNTFYKQSCIIYTEIIDQKIFMNKKMKAIWLFNFYEIDLDINGIVAINSLKSQEEDINFYNCEEKLNNFDIASFNILYDKIRYSGYKNENFFEIDNFELQLLKNFDKKNAYFLADFFFFKNTKI